MDRSTAETLKKILLEDSKSHHELFLQNMDEMKRGYEETVDFMKNLYEQMSDGNSEQLMHKTPKVRRKRHIQTIPENDIVTEKTVKNGTNIIKDEDTDDDFSVPTRIKRGASIKATQNIRIQQSLTRNTKQRRPSSSSERKIIITAPQSKRAKASSSESDEDQCRKPAKLNKMESYSRDSLKTKIKEEPMSCTENEEEVNFNQGNEKSVIYDVVQQITESSRSPRRSSRNSSGKFSSGRKVTNEAKSNPTIIEETLTEPDMSMAEPSMYEDALGKPQVPMNSTMNPNTTVTIDRKMLNVTVVLQKMNETVTLSKNSDTQLQERKQLSNEPIPSVLLIRENLQNKISTLKANIVTEEVDDLITDDESTLSSPNDHYEVQNNKQKILPQKLAPSKAQRYIDSDSDGCISSPEKPTPTNSQLKYQQQLAKHKQNALFSPYAKESVKKRVAAFEKVVNDKPDSDTAESTTGRITRTKTRAMANNNTEVGRTPSTATMLARKSLSKAKKICIAKEQREDEKENNLQNTAQKLKAQKNSRVIQKQQLRTTPVSKSRLQMPMSVSRIPVTPVGAQYLPINKASTISRANAASSSTDYLVSTSKPLSKSSSTDSLVDKRVRSTTEEDARRKKEDALKAQTEERRRRREEKEQKNKLAREARDKLEQEKRLKLEKEKEEKARFAMMQQEKMREEAEKKKIAQSQRAQEKEERRKREEQKKLQRIQEQEETERRLAEQKKREQEAERRRMADARAQQLAAAETAKLKQQYHAKLKQMQLKQQEESHGPTSYKIDSDPDDDESDNEYRPKHVIPHWARQEIRKHQLQMQQYIPTYSALRFFGAKKCTPNLSEFFVGIKKEQLKRTSSAVWKTPPRYSMMED